MKYSSRAIVMVVIRRERNYLLFTQTETLVFSGMEEITGSVGGDVKKEEKSSYVSL